MASYERISNVLNNNGTQQLGVGPNYASNFGIISKNVRAHGVTAIDILTGTVTYSALEGSGYGLSVPFTGVVDDKEVDAQNDPYRVGARFTMLNGASPVSYSYKALGED